MKRFLVRVVCTDSAVAERFAMQLMRMPRGFVLAVLGGGHFQFEFSDFGSCGTREMQASWNYNVAMVGGGCVEALEDKRS